MNIHIPAQRQAPAQVAATAAPAPEAELGWGGVVRVVVARLSLTMVLSLLVWSLLPLLIGWTPRVILSGSMEPRIHSGDVVVTRTVDTADLTKGHVITTVDPDSPEKTRTHRVLERDSEGKIVTKGDANRDPDSTSVSDADVLGLGVVRVAYIGLPAYWLAERNWLALAASTLFLGWAAVNVSAGRKRDDDSADRPTPPSSAPRHSRPRRVAASVAVAAMTVGVVSGPAEAAFTRKTTNPVSQFNAASTFFAYRTSVLADSPYLYWRLDETSGTAITDAGSEGHDGTLLASSYALGRAGALASEDTNTSLALTMGAITANDAVSGATGPGGPGPGPGPGPGGPAAETYSVEAWVKTTSSTGGRILGLGNGTGQNPSTVTDRQLYLAPTGKVMFGAGSGPGKVALASQSAVNNGSWHHVVGTSKGGPNGMMLYVDGVLQATGNAGTAAPGAVYWRAGAENLTGWPSAPDQYYDGGLDELAVYPTALSATRVRAHYNAGVTP